MTELIDAGPNLWFVLVWGLALFAAAVRFAVRPSERWVRFVLMLLVAEVLSGVACSLRGFIGLTVFLGSPEAAVEWRTIAVQGFGEALGPVFLGIAMAALAAFILSFGFFEAA